MEKTECDGMEKMECDRIENPKCGGSKFFTMFFF